MTTTFTETQQLAPTAPTAPSAVAAVRAQMSWSLMALRQSGVQRSFDPDAAGRRAVRKHGEALRRLGD